jgi:iron complex transport system substrate-binding protein
VKTVVRALVALAGMLGLAFVTACQSSTGAPAGPEGGESGGATRAGGFPVTIRHALGSTTIEQQPTRVATWGFGSTDAALALGLVPVAIPQQLYGGDSKGLLPWIKQELEKTGSQPKMLTNPAGSDAVPYEEFAEVKPDVILANYSGLTQEQYDTLSKIAPTVGYPDQPWATPWREVVTTTGTVLGKAEQAERLIADTEQQIADRAAEYPQLKGKTVAAVWDVDGTFYVYKKQDPRVDFLTDLGLTSAPSVDELATEENTFFYTLSLEQTSALTSDVLLVYADDQAGIDTFLSKPYAKSMEQVKAGHVAPVVGQEFVAAVSPPTVLSLTWGIDGYLEALAKGV